MKLIDILNWSEAWAPWIGIITCIIVRPKGRWVQPIITYLIVSAILGFLLDLIWMRNKFDLGAWMEANLTFLNDRYGRLSNGLLYNLLSLARLLIFSWLFFLLGGKTIFTVAMLIFSSALIFGFYVIYPQALTEFSSFQHAVEAANILILCLLYFVRVNQDLNIESPGRLPHSWAVNGLTFYSAVNFPIFLFYNYLAEHYLDYAIIVWNVHNVSYIILNILFAVSFIRARN